MTGPPMNNGWVQLPGGYQPNPVGQPQQQAPQGQQQQQAPQGQPQPGMQWVPPGPVGSPMDTTPPYYPQQPAMIRFNPQQPQQVQQQAQQPQGQSQQFVQQPLQVPQGTDLNARLTGPNIPQELQGRTFAEAMQIYNGMRNVVLQGLPAQQPAPAAQQVAPAQNPGPQPGQVAGFDWRQPDVSIRNAIRAELGDALAPLKSQALTQQIQVARNQAAADIGPAFGQLEGLIMQRLQGATPEALANPQMWKTAAESVLGSEVIRFARQQPQAPGAQHVQTGQPMAQPQMPAQPMPNLNGFFSEQPNVGAPVGAQAGLSPQQQYVAQAMGMDNATYLNWSAGGLRR